MSRTAPFGTWKSPLSAAAVAEAGLRLGAVAMDGEDIHWLEGRPHEGGRYVLVRRTPDGSINDVTPAGFNVRTRVHEYGGGAFLVAEGVAYCVNFSDQRVYQIVVGGSAGDGSGNQAGIVEAVPLTPPGGKRYADFSMDSRHRRLIGVREDHSNTGEPVNALVAVSLDGALAEAEVLVAGADFYSTPRVSPDGSTLAWLSWNHPQMPWDGTELWTATIGASGALENPVRVAGGSRESIYQPGWSSGGTLHFSSDRTGWWRLYRSERSGRSGGSDRCVELVVNPPPDAEFGRPQWVFGTSVWAQAGPSTLVVSYTRGGTWRLATIDLETGALTDLTDDLQPNEWLVSGDTHAVVVAGAATRFDAVVRIDVRTGQKEILRQASSMPLAREWISRAEPVEFPTTEGRTAHAFYYPPLNPDFDAPAPERPPLIVISHGGPTAAAHSTLSLQVQYWTTRGFAVVDVNYGGSTGYGRLYRERLNGHWGIVDVDDVIAAARYLASKGKADEQRLSIRGGSAGGYTTLASLTFHPEVFRAGASYYGISDLEALELDTHKFESRYSHSLIGPYPEARQTYRDRSPIHSLEKLGCPLILFQGLEDKVVPPNQSEMMADAVRARGLPVAYLAFEGEQHGFRQAETIVRCLEAELYFYGAVFGFVPDDAIPPVAIDNL
ncbi:MAG: S9 family peptidase [Acidobacteria bacterium]|nr:S9 family peptidase [Acidobacteriota bacterium]